MNKLLTQSPGSFVQFPAWASRKLGSPSDSCGWMKTGHSKTRVKESSLHIIKNTKPYIYIYIRNLSKQNIRNSPALPACLVEWGSVMGCLLCALALIADSP